MEYNPGHNQDQERIYNRQRCGASCHARWMACMDMDCSIGRILQRTVLRVCQRHALAQHGPAGCAIPTDNATGVTWTFQVAGCYKLLVRVSKLIDDDWRVAFDDEASYTKHKKAGRTIELKRERGVFVIHAFADPSNGKTRFYRRVSDDRRTP